MSDKLTAGQPKDMLGRPIIPSTTASTNCPLEDKPFECVCCKRLTAENVKRKKATNAQAVARYKAEAENAALVEALEFYATEIRYIGTVGHTIPDVMADGGDKARTALEKQ
ncbi:hypothetical protein LCGC14_1126360 [marine sediment metagenome]|uniref:Uncharacterized protein n=1 Tax=marine sediment metagenome TaxID=412755 RepID=A0A0F9Q880_9ZZZZ